MEAHLPNPPLPLLGRRAGRGVWTGAALPAVPGGGGGPTPTYMAQNDPHITLIILTAHMWGGVFFVKTNFPGQNLCSGAFGGQHLSLHKTKGPARKPISGTPPPPLLRRAPMPSPPRKAIFGPPSLTSGGGNGTLRRTQYMARAAAHFKRGAQPDWPPMARRIMCCVHRKARVAMALSTVSQA